MLLTVSFVFIILFTLLIAAIISVRVPAPRLSAFEIKRRVAAGNEQAAREQRLAVYRGVLVSLLWMMSAVLIAGTVAVAIVGHGIWTGLGVAVVVPLIALQVARLQLISRPAQRLFDRKREGLINLMSRYSAISAILRSPQRADDHEARIQSREEAEYLIRQSHQLFDVSERELLCRALYFDGRMIDECMVPYAQVVSVDKKELLGPLVLDDLHKTQHSRFPVVDGNRESIVGILNISTLLSVNAAQRTLTAEKAMDTTVPYLQQGASLRAALDVFMQQHRDLLIVVDADRRPVGLLTLRDVAGVLFGS